MMIFWEKFVKLQRNWSLPLRALGVAATMLFSTSLRAEIPLDLQSCLDRSSKPLHSFQQLDPSASCRQNQNAKINHEELKKKSLLMMGQEILANDLKDPESYGACEATYIGISNAAKKFIQFRQESCSILAAANGRLKSECADKKLKDCAPLTKEFIQAAESDSQNVSNLVSQAESGISELVKQNERVFQKYRSDFEILAGLGEEDLKLSDYGA